MTKNTPFVSPVASDVLDEQIKIELPDLSDVQNPIVKRLTQRVRDMKERNLNMGHQKHHSHDKTHYSSGW